MIIYCEVPRGHLQKRKGKSELKDMGILWLDLKKKKKSEKAEGW